MSWNALIMTDNLTGDSSNDGLNNMPKDSFYYIRLVCYVIIFIVGVVGNILVCLVVCRQRKMKNVTNYFIFNLAVSDLFVLLICIPFDFGEIVTGNFPYGAVMCRLIYPLQTMAATASVGTLVAISLNRWVGFIFFCFFRIDSFHWTDNELRMFCINDIRFDRRQGCMNPVATYSCRTFFFGHLEFKLREITLLFVEIKRHVK